MGPSDKNSSHDEFAQLVIARLRETGVTGEISYDPEEFEITVEGKIKSVLYLGNTYREYCSCSKKHRPNSVQRFVRGWLDAHKPVPDEYADIQPDILPAVRSRSFFESARLRMVIEGNDDTFLQYQTLGDDLGLGLVYDMPDSMRPISNQDIQDWGVTFYRALESARENLRELRPRIIGPKSGEGVYVFTTNDGYDSSRLIILDLIRQFQVKGDYIAMVPNREMLIIAGSEDKPGLEAMVALTKKAFEQPRIVSGAALRLVRDEWESWIPEPNHPLYDDFRALRSHSRGHDYAEQKELLDELHEKTGVDVFVGTYLAVKATGGQVFTYSIWSKDVPTLLPRTDSVAFQATTQAPVIARWEKVVEIAGDLMEPLGMYPERYRVESYPTAEQLAAMGSELEAK
jgi:uncharacterized protein YtpQ (UPF0354 family)